MKRNGSDGDGGNPRTRSWTSVLPVLFYFVLIAGFSLALWFFLRTEHRREQVKGLEAQAAHAGEEIRRALDVHVFALEAIARGWAGMAEPERSTFADAAALYAQRFAEVQAVEWVDPKGLIRWVVPEAGNESAAGRDLIFEPGRSDAMRRARESGRPAATPPVDLLQGGRGILTFVPLHREDEWGGFVLGVYRVDRLLGQVLRMYPRDGVRVAKAGQVLLDSQADQQWVSHEVEILGEPWTVSLSLSSTEGSSLGPAEVVLVIGLLLALAISISIHRDYRRRAEHDAEPLGSATIGVRLAAGFLLVAGLAAAISVISATQIERRVGRLESLEAPLLFDLLRLSSSFNAATQEGFAYLLSGELIEKDEHNEHRVVFQEAIDRILAALKDDSLARPGILRVGESSEPMWATWDRMIAEYERGEPFDEQAFHEIESYVDSIDLDLSAMIQSQRADVESAFAGASGLARLSKSLTVGSGFVTALVAALVGLLVSSVVTRQFEARARAEEDLEKRRRQETVLVEAKLNEARLQLVSRARLATIGQISAGIAHDLRNPLGAIRNAAYFLRRRLPSTDDKVVEHLGIIDQEVGISDSIITRLMDLAREQPPSKQLTELRDIVDKAIQRAGIPPGVECALDLNSDSFVVHADSVLLGQLLQNLLRNSVEALGERGKIEIRARHLELLDEIIVSDDGSGISEDMLDSLFEPFRTSKEGGTGMGLTICRQVITAHGGSIEYTKLSSAEPSAGGAAFRILLPRQLPAEAAASRTSS